MNQDQTYKKDISLRIAQRIVDCLKAGTITEDESIEMAQYALDNLSRKDINNAQVLDTLTDMVEKWPIFSDILTAELGKITDRREEQAVNQMSQLIKENRIDDALRVAHDVDSNPTGGTQ